MKKRKPILSSMSFTVEMDRPVDKDIHYISPGGYAFLMNLLGKEQEVAFDFSNSVGNIDKTNPRLVHFEVYDLDKEYTKDYVLLTKKNVRTSGYSEFFVYTGEYDDPEIHPVRVKSLTYGFEDNTSLTVSKEQLEQINKYLTD